VDIALAAATGNLAPAARSLPPIDRARSQNTPSMARQSKDLFDDSTMTFGEHLEALRVHLWKSILGLTVTIGVCLYYGQSIVGLVRQPIDSALAKVAAKKHDLKITDDVAKLEQEDLWDQAKRWWSSLTGSGEDPAPETELPPEEEPDPQVVRVKVSAHDLLGALHAAQPEVFAPPPDSMRGVMVPLALAAREFAEFRAATIQTLEPVTLNVQEAFMAYLKVSTIAGFVLGSPWVFYQLWQFVAAGLYRHERKFVYIYGAMSLVLFLVGAAFCFYGVFPFALGFLLDYNLKMQLTPQIRLSEWISFAVFLPLMFGISFQLPLAMRFLSAISIFDSDAYRSKRRMAILVIAFLSMLLTPAEPVSMLMMMFPLILLYELGILLCQFNPGGNPFEEETA
jgi:sec-independent protein translocase protein TatC